MTKDVILKTEQDLKLFLQQQYRKQIDNFFGDNKKSLKFLSSVMTSVQTNPKLLECEPNSLVNAFMKIAQLALMPSDVSGEAYVITYKIKGVSYARFQLGYQGLITLFFRAGGLKLRTEIVRANDKFEYTNGEITHTVDIFKTKEQRGEAVGAYAIATLASGQEAAYAMNAQDILAYGKQFSKSFSSSHTPWDEKNDPELWMWKKTVLKQLGKTLPKNETINLALAEDNKDSTLQDKLQEVEVPTMANLETTPAQLAEPKQQEPTTQEVADMYEGTVVDQYNCSACQKNIDEKVHGFSMSRYKKPLCRDCQKV